MAPSFEAAKSLLLAPLDGLEKPVCYDVRQRRWFTGLELRRSVEACAALLSTPQKGLAFCYCDNTIESLTAYLACWTAGHAVLLLDPRLDAAFQERLGAVYRPEFVLASRSNPVELEFEGAGNYALAASGDIGIWRAQRFAETPLHPDLAVLLSTSGSTGSPKLVRLSHRNIVANALQIREALSIHAGERAITSLPMYYSYGLSVVNSHLAAGASLVLTGEGILSSAFWSAFRENGCTSLAAIPYMYQMLQRLDLKTLNVPTLHTMTQAGGKLHDSLMARFHALMAERGGRFFVMYGQTEATARIAVLPAECLPAKLGSVGKALPGGSLAVEKDGATATEPFAEGELVYTGPNVMMGYATGREDLAQPATLNEKLHTGDLGHFDEDGFFYVTGRNKRFAKIVGLRINLDEVETLLKVNGPTAVLGGADRLLIYCEYGGETVFPAYAHSLSEKLKLHPSLFAFRRIESLPLNSNGKPDYQKLAAE